MKFSKTAAAFVMGLSMLPFAASAGDSGTIYTQLSTNGLGIGYATSISEDWALRGQYNTYQRSFAGDVGDFGSTARLTADINLSTLQALADWYPTDSGFRMTGGVVFNNNKITLTGTGATVGSSTNQNVNAEIKMSDGLSPYLGIGYATKPKYAKGFGFNLDVGVMFQNPKATMTASGASQADIDAQLVKVNEAMDKLKYMPVVGMGLSYSF